jgi:hypothetical protein
MAFRQTPPLRLPALHTFRIGCILLDYLRVIQGPRFNVLSLHHISPESDVAQDQLQATQTTYGGVKDP